MRNTIFLLLGWLLLSSGFVCGQVDGGVEESLRTAYGPFEIECEDGSYRKAAFDKFGKVIVFSHFDAGGNLVSENSYRVKFPGKPGVVIEAFWDGENLCCFYQRQGSGGKNSQMLTVRKFNSETGEVILNEDIAEFDFSNYDFRTVNRLFSDRNVPKTIYGIRSIRPFRSPDNQLFLFVVGVYRGGKLPFSLQAIVVNRSMEKVMETNKSFEDMRGTYLLDAGIGNDGALHIVLNSSERISILGPDMDELKAKAVGLIDYEYLLINPDNQIAKSKKIAIPEGSIRDIFVKVTGDDLVVLSGLYSEKEEVDYTGHFFMTLSEGTEIFQESASFPKPMTATTPWKKMEIFSNDLQQFSVRQVEMGEQEDGSIICIMSRYTVMFPASPMKNGHVDGGDYVVSINPRSGFNWRHFLPRLQSTSDDGERFMAVLHRADHNPTDFMGSKAFIFPDQTILIHSISGEVESSEMRSHAQNVIGDPGSVVATRISPEGKVDRIKLHGPLERGEHFVVPSTTITPRDRLYLSILKGKNFDVVKVSTDLIK